MFQTENDQCKGPEIEKKSLESLRTGQEHSKVEEKWVREKVVRDEVFSNLSGTRFRRVGFRPYPKFNGKPLKVFLEDSIIGPNSLSHCNKLYIHTFATAFLLDFGFEHISVFEQWDSSGRVGSSRLEVLTQMDLPPVFLSFPP